MGPNEAVEVIKRTQPKLDAVKHDKRANEDAKKVLGQYMVEKNLTTYRGIQMSESDYETWLTEDLMKELGDRVGKFRVKRARRYFRVLPPRRGAKA